MKKNLLLLMITFTCLKVFSQVKGSDCDISSSTAIELYSQKQFREAIPYFQKSLVICSKDSTMSDNDYYFLLAAASIAYYEVGNEDSAIITGEGAAKYFERTKAFDDPIYNTMLGRLALSYEYFGEYENAVTSFEKCIPFFEKRLGKIHEVTLEYKLELATCYSAMEDFTKAFRLNESLKKLILDSIGKKSTVYIGVITNMGNDFIKSGSYDSALYYYKESLNLRESLFGSSHIEVARGNSFLGYVYNEMNRFGDAIIYYEKAKALFIAKGLTQQNDYGTLLNNLSNSYRNIGNLQKAFDLVAESLKVKRRLYGNYHPDVAAGVNLLGNIYEETFDYAHALEAYRFSKYILERLNKTANLQYASVLSNLGNCFTSVSKYDSALYFLQLAKNLKEQVLGPNHISVALSLNNIAGLYSDLNRFQEAEASYLKAKSIVESIFGKMGYQLTSILENMALMFKAKNEFERSDSLFKESYRIASNFLLNNTEGLSEKDKETFAEGIRLNQYTALSLRTDTSLKNDWIYNSSLFYKGILLEGSKGFTAAFKDLKDTAIQKKVSSYLGLKKYIGSQMLKPEASRSDDFHSAIDKAASLERELIKISIAFRNWKDQFKTELIDIQKHLTTEQVSIEFLAYYPLGIKTPDSTLYAAMILKPGSKDPLIIPLFYETEFKKLLPKAGSTETVVKKLYRSSVKGSASQSTASDSLYYLIWKPLLPYLQNAKTVYFSADGIINNLNLAAIITPGGKRLVEDYEFIQLSSTRNIVKPATTPSFKELQLWGGIRYNENTATSTTRSNTFAYLPGTLTEVNEIAAVVGKSSNVKTVIATDANELAFKNLSGRSPEVLHIATHGFFFPDPENHGRTDDNRFAKASNPLLRSGLALADANNNWSEGLISSDKEDGILTAYEIADMDLSKTKLVVLSACETGLGDIKSGEGVYGLQRAFKLAGVNYLIMSLWQVPDLETKEFMQTFYKNCTSGMPIRKAFRETQLAMNKKYQPYQWAAFVLVE